VKTSKILDDMNLLCFETQKIRVALNRTLMQIQPFTLLWNY